MATPKIDENLRSRIDFFVEEFLKSCESFIENDRKSLMHKPITNEPEPTLRKAAVSGAASAFSFFGTTKFLSKPVGSAANYLFDERDKSKRLDEASKRENFTNLSTASEEKRVKYLIGAALDLFQSFEVQFAKVVSTNENVLEAMSLLAQDAAKKLKNYLQQLPSESFEPEKISKYVLEGELSDSLKAKLIPNKIKKNMSSEEIWEIESFYKEIGVVIIKSHDELVFYHTKNDKMSSTVYDKRTLSHFQQFEVGDSSERSFESDSTRSRYGYRRLLFSENEDEIKEKYEKEKPSTLLGNYYYKMTRTNIEQLKTEFLQKFYGKKLPTNKDVLKVGANIKEEVQSMIVQLEENITTKIDEIVNNESQQWKEKDPIVYNFRYPVQNYIERGNMIQIIHKILSSEKNTVHIALTAVTSGLGGIGKSELARRYAYFYSEKEKFYKNIIWITAEKCESIIESFKNLLKENFNFDNFEGLDAAKIILNLYKNLEKCGKTLIIMDNAENFQTIEKFLQRSSFGNNLRFLITSRIREWDTGSDGDIEVIELEVFSESEAFQLVSSSLKISAEAQKEDIKELIELLQYFPLALGQAVSYIKVQSTKGKKWGKPYSIKNYLDLIKETNILNALENKVNCLKEDRYKMTIKTTWLTTLNILKKDENGLKAISKLQDFAFMAPDAINVESIYEINDEVILAIELLDHYSMVKLNDGIVSIHRLVQEVMRSEHKENEEINTLKRVLENLHTKIDENLNHLVVAWKFGVHHDSLVKKYNLMFEKILDELIEKVKYSEVVSLVNLISEKLDHLIGADHHVTLNVKRCFGKALLRQLKYGESLKVYQNVLRIQNHKFGEIHRDTLLTMFEYASCIDEMGAHETALKVFFDIMVPIDVIRNFDGNHVLWKCNVKDKIGDICLKQKNYEISKKFLELSSLEKMTAFGCEHQEYLYTKSFLELVNARLVSELLAIVDTLFKSENSNNPASLKILEKFGLYGIRKFNKNIALHFHRSLLEKSSKVYEKNDPNILRIKKVIESLSNENDPNSWEESQNTVTLAINNFDQKCVPKESLVHLLNLLNNYYKEITLFDVIQDIGIACLRGGSPVFLEQQKLIKNNLTVLDYHKAIANDDTTSLIELFDSNINSINETDMHGNTPLMWAIIKGNLATVKLFIDKGADLHKPNIYNYTALHWAVKSENKEIVQLVLSAITDLKFPNSSHSVLHEAVKNVEILELLLNKNFEVDSVDFNHNTPLMWACFLGKIQSMEILLNFGANIDHVTNLFGQTALQWAISNKDALMCLFKNVANISDAQRISLINEASMYRDVNVLKRILEVIGTNNVAYAERNEGYYPIIIACKNGNLEVAQYLFDHGADIDSKCYDGCTPLFWAARNGHLDVLKWLIEKSVDINFITGTKCECNDLECFHGWSVLHTAAFSGDFKILEFVIESLKLKNFGVLKYEDVNKKTCKGLTPLLLAFKVNSINTAKLLLSNGADVELKDENGLTILHHAMKMKRRNFLKLFINDFKADVTIVDNHNSTLLHYAASVGDFNITTLILRAMKERNFDAINALDNDGDPPFQWACQSGNLTEAGMLLDCGAKINHKGNDGNTALHWAAFEGQVHVVQWLLEKGADVNVINNEDETILHAAVVENTNGSNGMLELVFNAMKQSDKSKIDHQNKNGDTAIMVACKNSEKLGIIKYLVEAGADLTIQNYERKSALDIAVANGNKEIQDYISQHLEKS